jgi:hypothetical protein
MTDIDPEAARCRLECLKLAVPLSGPSEPDRVASVVEIATRLYNFTVAGDISAQTSPDRTLRLGSKRK